MTSTKTVFCNNRKQKRMLNRACIMFVSFILHRKHFLNTTFVSPAAPVVGALLKRKALLHFPPRAKSIAWSDLKNKTFGTNKNQKLINEKHKTQKQRNDVVLHSRKRKGSKRRASTTPEFEREKTDRMTFSVDLQEAEADPGRSPTPKRDEVAWVPLQNHPVFFPATGPVRDPTAARLLRNLLAWDGASRLYFWDPDKLCLHRISIRLGEPDPTSVLAASPSKVSTLSLISFCKICLFKSGC